MSHARNDGIIASEKFFDGFGFCGRLDNDEVFAHDVKIIFFNLYRLFPISQMKMCFLKKNSISGVFEYR